MGTGALPIGDPIQPLLGYGVDRDHLAMTAPRLELHHAVHEGEERVVTTAPHVAARVELRPPLTNQDVAGEHALTTEALHAQVLRIRVPAVAARTDAFLMSHVPSSADAD